MQGLDISKEYFETYGRAMVEEFPSMAPYFCIGLVGAGSECLRMDDEVSKDHDFEPGFCIFIPGEDLVERRDAFMLQRAYDKLPKKFLGLKREIVAPEGGKRHGVIRIDEFLKNHLGTSDYRLSNEQWMRVPEQSLLEIVNGEIFFDNYGLFSQARERLAFFPEDIRLKKLSGCLAQMAQDGQYNAKRCLEHGEKAAAQVSLNHFVESAVHAIYLINREYMPYFKWQFKMMDGLKKLKDCKDMLGYILLSSQQEIKFSYVVKVSERICEELAAEGIGLEGSNNLSEQAMAVNGKISDIFLRNANIFID